MPGFVVAALVYTSFWPAALMDKALPATFIIASRVFPDLSAGEFQKQIFQVGGAVQRAQVRVGFTDSWLVVGRLEPGPITGCLSQHRA